jgi:hypothetical protein
MWVEAMSKGLNVKLVVSVSAAYGCLVARYKYLALKAAFHTSNDLSNAAMYHFEKVFPTCHLSTEFEDGVMILRAPASRLERSPLELSQDFGASL